MPKDSLGNYLTTATTVGTFTQATVFRYDPTGILDPSYATGGVFNLPFVGPLADNSGGIAVNPDNSQIALVTNFKATPNDITLVKLTAAGAVDTTWGTLGYVTAGTGGANSVGSAATHGLFIESTGKIVVAWNDGTGDGEGRVSRFSAAGVLEYEQSLADAVVGIAPISGDDAYFIATKNINTQEVRVGTIDFSGPTVSGFGALGLGDWLPAPTDPQGYGVVGAVVDAAGNFVLPGTNAGNTDAVVARITPGFAPDATWGTAGLTTIASPFLAALAAREITPGGDILVSGGSSNGWATARLDSTGTLVGGYGTAGVREYLPETTSGSAIHDSHIDTPSTIFHWGAFMDTAFRPMVGRTLLADGEWDTTWGTP